jgi:hypothetical protein
MLKRLLIQTFSMRPENTPSWRKQWDAVNLAITAVVVLFILWATFR